MCGIVGYIGRKNAAPIIIDGLKRLEYRGYDSFGLATQGKKCIELFKKQGRITDCRANAVNLSGRSGVGHTRWATHGVPNDINAHPHMDCTDKIFVVHNGIIENYLELRRELIAKGHTLRSDTDTEVIAHLIEEHYTGNLFDAVGKVVPRLTGSYALLVLAEGEDQIIAARDKSPLVLGIGDQEMFAASDMTPLLPHTERVIFLEDGDIARITSKGYEIFFNGTKVNRPLEFINWSAEDVKKGGFKHYMLKEIYEQPRVFYDSVRSVTEESLPSPIISPLSVTIIACGTSYHAALIFKYLLEMYCLIPARVEFASEYKYFTPPVTGVVIGISQSGETADTLAALNVAKAHNCTTVAITNVLGSSITRVADHTIYMRAGPEVSVAATKSFIAQLAVMMQLVTIMMNDNFGSFLAHAHHVIEDALLVNPEPAVEACRHAEHIFYIGRGAFYPVALEGALKMKEISYIHAEGYPAGEIKHGPFALLSERTPVLAICTPGESHGVMLSNIRELKARGAPVIGIGVKGDQDLEEVADIFLPLPDSNPLLHIVTCSVIFQLIAYHTADALGRDIDRPRNLAKSVTVE